MNINKLIIFLASLLSKTFILAYTVTIGIQGNLKVVDGRLYIPAGTTIYVWAEPRAGFFPQQFIYTIQLLTRIIIGWLPNK